ncbi:MAG: GDP-mannose 4,6-dehydratase, partial [Candidatus Omnitrophota bacterium]|nr:GDP-mannose 4,6-dehydratase [Candidatus Omnitrophota bacterium]
MRVLVTGGAGMVGSHTAEYYAKKGNKVIVLDNLMRSKLFGYDKKSVEYNWNYLAKYKSIKRIKGDVRLKKDVLEAIGKGVDVVIHTAGQPGVPLSIRIPEEDFSINAYGTLNVLECVRQRCKDAVFIYCSTNKVYGENVDKIALLEKKTRYVYKNIKGIPVTLSIDHTGHTPYGVSKYVGDIYVQEYAHIYGMKTAVFRMSCIYGIRQFGFEDQGWVSWFVIANLLGKPITVYGNGKQVRDLLYVTDLVKAYDKFIHSDLRHEVFNIGGGPRNTISLLEFIEAIKKETGRQNPVSFDDWRPSDQKVYISDISKVKKALNWNPSISPQDGM